jgi:hypothetical protein
LKIEIPKRNIVIFIDDIYIKNMVNLNLDIAYLNCDFNMIFIGMMVEIKNIHKGMEKKELNVSK